MGKMQHKASTSKRKKKKKDLVDRHHRLDE